MDFIQSYFSPDIFNWVVLPVLIFFSRIIDVSIGTLRIILVSRGNKIVAPLLGFFEVIIWLVAIGAIMQNLNNILCYVAYGGGFAMGNLLGILLEEKLAMGDVLIRAVTKKPANECIVNLRKKGFGVTVVQAEGAFGPVSIFYTIVERNNLQSVINDIKTYNPNAFFSIEDVKKVSEGIFPTKHSDHRIRRFRLFDYFKKGK